VAAALVGVDDETGGATRWARERRPVTGEVISASPNSSYNAVPLLVLLTETTGDGRYLAAAIRVAAEGSSFPARLAVSPSAEHASGG
jgi:hypothetical protein